MRGFTLIELIIVLSIIAVVGSVVATGFQAVRNIRDPQTASQAMELSLADARDRSLAMQLDAPWGVEVLTGQIVTFKGATYATRDTAQDRKISIPTTVTASGATEIDFGKFTGVPQTAATTTFSTALASSSAYVLSGGASGISP